MHRRLTAVAAALCLTLVAPPLTASADPSSPPASPPPSPPPASPSAAPSTPASPSPSPSASAGATPGTAEAVEIAEEVERAAGIRADLMRRVIAATSLLERIEAQRRLAAAERELLVGCIEMTRRELEEHVVRSLTIRAQAEERRAALERLLQQTYRVSRTSALEVLLRRGSVVDVVVHLDGLAALSEQEARLLDELRTLEAELERRREEIARHEAELRTLAEAVEAKDAALAALAARAERLTGAAQRGGRAASDAELALLRELAEAHAKETQATTDLIVEIARRSGVELPAADRWTWPLEGRVTQEFGPSSFPLEPPKTYRGVFYPHFHDGLDIAAPLGSPVRAAARGRVAFVGHVAGGALVVVVAHEDGHVTLYGHLDDTTAPPPVRAGDIVEAGERIGAVGLTGVTTGAHLHFVVSLGEEAIDPRVVLPTAP